MRQFVIQHDLPGLKMDPITIDIPDMINSIKGNKALFVSSVIEIISEIDLSDCELEDWQIAVIRGKYTELGKILKIFDLYQKRDV